MMSDIQYEDYAQALIDKSLATYVSYQNTMKLSDDVVSLLTQKDDATLEAIAYWKQKLDHLRIMIDVSSIYPNFALITKFSTLFEKI